MRTSYGDCSSPEIAFSLHGIEMIAVPAVRIGFKTDDSTHFFNRGKIKLGGSPCVPIDLRLIEATQLLIVVLGVRYVE